MGDYDDDEVFQEELLDLLHTIPGDLLVIELGVYDKAADHFMNEVLKRLEDRRQEALDLEGTEGSYETSP